MLRRHRQLPRRRPTGLIVVGGMVAIGLVSVLGVDRGSNDVAEAAVQATIVAVEAISVQVDDVAGRAVAVATLPCGSGLQATSSGFVFDDRTVVTVAHAIFESRDFAVRDATGTWHRAVLDHLDVERDLAFLHVETLRADPMTKAVASATTPIRLLGGAASGRVDGTVRRPVTIRTALVGELDHTAVRRGYELDLLIAVGDSGAAVVDDLGQLVGVVFARSTNRPGISWATAVDEVESAANGRGAPPWDCAPEPGGELVLGLPTAP